MLTPGRYRITPTVLDPNGKGTSESMMEDFTAGEHTARWNITRDHADMMGLKGPLTLTEVHVVRQDSSSEFGGDLAGWWLNQSGAWKAK